MPLFDPLNPRSPDAAALYHTAVLLSEQAAFQRLSETADATEAFTKIIRGVHARPDDNDQYEIAELQELFCEAQIHPPVPAEGTLINSDGGPEPMVTGAFDLRIRRHARESELNDGRNDLYMWFYDEICTLKRDMLRQAGVQECPRLVSIEPVCDGAFDEWKTTSAQGEYLWAYFRVLWGDEIE